MNGWIASDLARKYEGLRVVRSLFDDDHIWLEFENGVANDSGIIFFSDHADRNDWIILNCHHPKDQMTISTNYCCLCETYLKEQC